MKRLYSYEEYKKECLQNKYSKVNYDSHDIETSEKRMKRAYDGYVFRFNALKEAEDQERKIREKYKFMQNDAC